MAAKKIYYSCLDTLKPVRVTDRIKMVSAVEKAYEL